MIKAEEKKAGIVVRALIYLKGIVCRIIERSLRNKKERLVLFAVRNEIMFHYAYAIYERLKSDKRLKVLFCFVTPEQFVNLAKVKAEYRVPGIPFFFARKIKWDLIVFPDHHYGFLPKCPKIYIGHGLSTSRIVDGDDYVFGRRAYDERGQMIYRKIFWPSEFVAEQIQEKLPQFTPFIKVTGSLLLDAMPSLVSDREKELKRLGLDPAKKTVLIASTWREESLIQSSAMDLARELPSVLAQYNVILSIHLNNFTKGKIEWQGYLAQVKHKNFYRIDPTEYVYPFLPLADLLVMDITSLGLFYTIFERPVVYFKQPGMSYGVGDTLGQLEDAAYVIDDLVDLRSRIDQGFKNFDPRRMRSFTEKVFSHRGMAWQRHQEEIYDSLSL